MPAVEDGEFGVPAAKRQKVATRHGSLRQKDSRIFTPFRVCSPTPPSQVFYCELTVPKTLGLVSPSPVPFTSIPLGKTTFQITTSVGRSLQTYDLRRGLNLVFLSRPQTPGPITATCAWKDRTIAAWASEQTGVQSGVWIFKRGKKVGELEKSIALKAPVNTLITVGSWIIGSTGNTIEVWKSSTYEHYATLTPTIGYSSRSVNHITTFCHMPTFLNKVFVGTRDGNVEVWNVSTGLVGPNCCLKTMLMWLQKTCVYDSSSIDGLWRRHCSSAYSSPVTPCNWV